MCFRLNRILAILSLVTKNYRAVSLLPTSGKVFESIFMAKNLLAPSQSGFKPGDSCINQLLSITHEIYSSFDDGFEVRSVFFLDISKPLDKVWHEEIIFKLQLNGISDDLLNIKELRLMVSPLQGPKLMQGSPKDLS